MATCVRAQTASRTPQERGAARPRSLQLPQARTHVSVAAAASRGTSEGTSGYPNPVGVHALVFAGDLSEASVRKAAAGAAAAGYDLLELPAFDAASIDAPMVRAVFEEHGLQPACSLGLSLDADVSSDDPAVVARGAAELAAALDFAAAIGARHLCGILYSALAKYPGPPTAAGRAHAVAEIRALAARAADRGVRVCLEVVNRYETNLLNTAAQAMDFLADVNHPNAHVHLDTYHMNIEEASCGQAVRLCGDRLGYVHLGDSFRGYLGTGSVDFPDLFRALADTGFTGPMTFESFSSAVVNPSLSNTLCIWRDTWQDSADLAAHARAYVDVSWRAARAAAAQPARR